MLLGFFFIIIGLIFALIVLSGPNTNDLKNGLFKGSSNIATIKAYKILKNGKQQAINGVLYDIHIVPDTGNDNILISITSSLKQSENTIYEVTWPGEITPHYFNQIALDADKNTSSELLGVKITTVLDDSTEMTINSRNEFYHNYNDYFMFYWKNGKEKITFTDSRIRLQVVPINSNDSITLKIGLTENNSLTNETPEASKVIPNIDMGAIERIYNNDSNGSGNMILVSYLDLNKKRIADFLLILSGLFIGIGTSFLTNWLISEIDLLRRRK